MAPTFTTRLGPPAPTTRLPPSALTPTSCCLCCSLHCATGIPNADVTPLFLRVDCYFSIALCCSRYHCSPHCTALPSMLRSTVASCKNLQLLLCAACYHHSLPGTTALLMLLHLDCCISYMLLFPFLMQPLSLLSNCTTVNVNAFFC